MTDDARNPGLFTRMWRALLETSEVAVAARYHAPWQASIAPAVSKGHRRDIPARADRPSPRADVLRSRAA